MKRSTQSLVFALVFAFYQISAFANPITALIGTYPVLTENGKNAVGFLEVVSDATSVGIKLEGLTLVSNSVMTERLLSAPNATQVTENGGLISQTFQSAAGSVLITYLSGDGYMQIIAKTCDAANVCEQKSFDVSTGKSPGNLVDAVSFFNQRAGDYKLIKAALTTPEAGKDKGFVEVGDGYSMVSFQYCLPNFCDPIYLYWDSPTVTVYERVENDVTTYDILVEGTEGPEYYRWEEFATGEKRFQNFHWVKDGQLLGMEHDIQKM